MLTNFPVDKCMFFFKLSITHNKLLANVILATSFGSKNVLSSGHYKRTEKIETLPLSREFLNICIVSTYLPIYLLCSILTLLVSGHQKLA